jgi:hypothetical protein
MIVVDVYRKGCIKRSPLVERKGKFHKRFFSCSDWVLVKVLKVQTHRSTHRVFG